MCMGTMAVVVTTEEKLISPCLRSGLLIGYVIITIILNQQHAITVHDIPNTIITNPPIPIILIRVPVICPIRHTLHLHRRLLTTNNIKCICVLVVLASLLLITAVVVVVVAAVEVTVVVMVIVGEVGLVGFGGAGVG